jgi:multidrug efflux pump subunit AcrB
MGKDRKIAAEVGSAEVFGPMVGSTLTTVAGFLPLAFWPGMMGKFMRYLPITIIIGLTASLIMAIVVNPVLCAKFLRCKMFRRGEHPEKSISDKVNEKFEKLRGDYERLLAWALDNYKKVIRFAGIAFVISLVVLGTIPKQFFPEMPPKEFFVDITMPVSSSLKATDEVVLKIESYLKKNKDIKWYVSSVGNMGASGGSMVSSGSDKSDIARITVKVKDDKERKQTPDQILENVRKFVKTLPGVEVEISKEEGGPPSGSPISIKIVGDEFKVLKDISDKVKKVMGEVKGVVDIRDNYDDSSAEMHVVIDRNKAAYYGLSDVTIAMAVRSAFNGTVATKYREANDEYDVLVKLDDSYKKDLNALRSITIPTKTGKHVPLEKVAQIKTSSGLSSVSREDYDRIIKVEADTDAKTLPFVALKQIRKTIDKFELPEGYRFEYTGEIQEKEKSFAFLGQALKIGVLMIAVVLVMQFNSYVLPFIVCITIGLSIIGVVLCLKITGRPFGLMAFLVVVSLAGVVVNNGIFLIDYILARRARGHEKREAIIRACSIRLRPVMLTVITTILGMVPVTVGFSIDFKKLAVTGGGDSSLYWGPMGAAVIFGLMVSTILTLFVVPCLYYWFEDLAQKFQEPQAAKISAENNGCDIANIDPKLLEE